MTPQQKEWRAREKVGRWQRAGLLSLGVPYSDLMRMTPAQIHQVGFYPREKFGELKTPRLPTPARGQAEPTLERDLMVLEGFRGMISPAKYEEARAKLHARYAEGKGDAVGGVADAAV